MPDSYTKEQIEPALFDNGFNVLQEKGGFTIYQTHIFPGSDIVIDWSREHYEWRDLERQLIYQSIDPKPIYDYLLKH